MEREELFNTLSLASLALAKEDESILPVLAGFKFAKKRIVTYDDVIAMSLAFDVGVEGIVPGHPLLRFLSSVSGQDVGIDSVGSEFHAKCARARLLLPITDLGEWPFKQPKTGDGFKIELNEAFFRGLDLCAAIVPDKGLSSWMGGVNFYFGKTLRMYGLNGTRDGICHYTLPELGTGQKVERFIVPVSFCKAASAMAKTYGMEGVTLHVTPALMTMTFKGDAVLFGKMIESDSQNIAGRVKGIMDEIGDEFYSITPELADGLKRMNAMCGKDGECTVTITGTKLKLQAGAGPGSFTENVTLEEAHPDVTVTVNAPVLLKMLGDCQQVRFLQNTTVGRADDSFAYIVANKV